MGALGSGIAAALAGALDGLGASRDQNAGRHWDSPGITATGLPLLDWGWAPAVQVGSIAAGFGAEQAGFEWGRGLFGAGVGMVARAFAFKLAQRGANPTQGYVDVDWRQPPNPVAPGTPGRSYVSNNFGFRQPPFDTYDNGVPDGTQVDPAANFGGRISAFRQPAFSTDSSAPAPYGHYDNPQDADEFGGRISGARRRQLADGSNVPPGSPQSHYVSTYGGFPPG